MKRSLGFALVLLFGMGSVAVAQASKDAVAVDPTHHHVIFENDHVRIFEALASPGATSPMHTHHPLVAIFLDRGRLRMATPDGESFIFDLHPSQVVWLEGVEHSWELLSGQVHVIAVEPKAAARGPAPATEALGPKDPVAVDPTHHQVILDNDHVRVWEALASPGARSATHTHPPFALISLGRARMKMTTPDGNTSIFDLRPAQVVWLDGLEHSWEMLSGEVHVIGVEVKAARKPTS